MKDSRWFAVVYMFGLTALASAVLIGFAQSTRHLVAANQQLALERAVLEAFVDIPIPSNRQVHSIFTELISQPPEAQGAYVYRKNGQLMGYAVPISGQGFWAKISGIVAVSADLSRVVGISFYEQNETPGLGARIVGKDFRQQFEGLQIVSIDKPIAIRPVSEVLRAGQVHAISGATQTCIRLEAMLNRQLSDWLAKMRVSGGMAQ